MSAARESGMEAAGVNRNGHHFVRRGSDFQWMHPAEIREGDEDCTFMDDEQFEACARAALSKAAGSAS